MKFRGAGQGRKALVAEIIAGELARRLGLRGARAGPGRRRPELSRAEPDEEVQDLLRASAGLNLGIDFLPGALGYDGLGWRPDPELAARVVWFDALVSNADRSWRNPNLLVWHRRLWLIDHGATLWFHHSWTGAATASSASAARRPYDASEHALAAVVGDLRAADAELAAAGHPRAASPRWSPWCPTSGWSTSPASTVRDAVRAAYVEHLLPAAWPRRAADGACGAAA